MSDWRDDGDFEEAVRSPYRCSDMSCGCHDCTRCYPGSADAEYQRDLQEEAFNEALLREEADHAD